MNLPPILTLALASLRSRKVSAALTVLAVAVSVMLFLGVEKLRHSAQASFESTISGTNLIVGARTSPVSLLLFSVFHIGDPGANISYETYETISAREDVAWTVPISLGDSHRGYRVVGTSDAFLTYYKHGNDRALALSDGAWFGDLYDVVIGADVARSFEYVPGTQITLSHGTGAVSFMPHDNRPFTVSGVLARTGTPVDKSLFVSLEAIEAMHYGWQSGAPSPLARVTSADEVRNADLRPKSIAAIFVGLENRLTLLRTQRSLNTFPDEALVAAQPGPASAQLWEIIGVAEKALLGVSAFVVLVGLVSILTNIMTSLRERRREMAVLRAVGARPAHVFLLLVSEAVLLAASGALLGIVMVAAGQMLIRPLAENLFGLTLAIGWPGLTDLIVFLVVSGLAGLLAAGPALVGLRRSLEDGLSVRI